MKTISWVVVESTPDETLSVHGPYSFLDFAKDSLKNLVAEYNKNDTDCPESKKLTINSDGLSATGYEYRLEIIRMN